MTIDKNTKSTPKCQGMCLVSSCKISGSLDQRPAFHKGISMARYANCDHIVTSEEINAH